MLTDVRLQVCTVVLLHYHFIYCRA